jgi:predicted nucleic acid-binding Zn ribbon protein
MSNGGPGMPFSRRGPKPLGEILGSLLESRGYGRLRGQAELEAAWNAAVGEPACRRTKLGALRRGVLPVTVAHPALLQELSAFRKTELLQALRRAVPDVALHDFRFRVGPVEEESSGTAPAV